ncbi:MAG: hypothetical protein ACD_41C00315G0009, partial [uncultured bacterium]
QKARLDSRKESQKNLALFLGVYKISQDDKLFFRFCQYRQDIPTILANFVTNQL